MGFTGRELETTLGWIQASGRRAQDMERQHQYKDLMLLLLLVYIYIDLYVISFIYI